MLADDLVNRAPKIKIDEIGLDPLDHGLRRTGHLVWITTEELDAERPLHRLKRDHFPGALVAMKDAVSRNELRYHDISALLLAQPAENGVGDAGHGRQEERTERAIKPGKHAEPANNRLWLVLNRHGCQSRL